jgi:hypothetical protein
MVLAVVEGEMEIRRVKLTGIKGEGWSIQLEVYQYRPYNEELYD